MKVEEKEIIIPKIKNRNGLLEYFANNIIERLNPDEIPIRFVVTHTSDKEYKCELGVLTDAGGLEALPKDSIFKFRKRDFEDAEQFNAVLLIPTGIGAEIGGHSGDGGPTARLLASACDTLITHPNVVNAADINELPENGLYVEGSVISRLLMGIVGLQKVRSNRVMLVIDEQSDEFFNEACINSASAARAALGLDCPIVIKMADNVLMRSVYSKSGRATGKIEHLEYLCELLKEYQSQYDAVALASSIEVPTNYHKDYFHQDMINPWGGVEAMLTHAISTLFNIPSAHSPMMSSKEILNLSVGVVDPRKSAEAVSTTYLHCILKGLHKSPGIITNLSSGNYPGVLTSENIACLIIPDGCVGLPTLAAMEQGIPVIAVKENKNCMKNKLEDLPFQHGKFFMADNYLEAVGIMNAIKTGISLDSVRRPISDTVVHVKRR